VLQPGDLRVDVDAANDTTVVTVVAGQAQVDGNGLEQVMQPGESLLLSGSNPVSAQNVRRAAAGRAGPLLHR
jgi:ferric-dicitrate binding protein FerR (iron transport regulator)